MRDFWQYEQQRDLALQKHFRAKSRWFHSFPAFPQHICEDLSEEYTPEAPEEATPEAPTRPPEATQPAPVATSSMQCDKGKVVVPETSSRQTTLQSAMSGKWLG